MLTWTKNEADGSLENLGSGFRITARSGGKHKLMTGDTVLFAGKMSECKAEADRLSSLTQDTSEDAANASYDSDDTLSPVENDPVPAQEKPETPVEALESLRTDDLPENAANPTKGVSEVPGASYAVIEAVQESTQDVEEPDNTPEMCVNVDNTTPVSPEEPMPVSTLSSYKEGISSRPLHAPVCSPATVVVEPSQPVPINYTPLDAQTILNELVYKHGSNVTEWSSYPQLLQEVGLSFATVTPKMLAEADQWCRLRHDQLIDWRPSETKAEGLSIYDEWRSKCGRYRIVRQSDRFVATARNPEGKERFVEQDAKRPGNYPKEYRNLEGALLAVETYHKAKLGQDKVESNRKQALLEAEKKGKNKLTNTVVDSEGKPVTPKELKEPKEIRTRTPGVNQDQWGHKIGSQPSLINAVLSTTPQTTQAIADKCGLGLKRVTEHLQYWMKRDGRFLETAPNTFALKS